MENPPKPNRPLTVFVDADAFVALAREDDTNHPRALKILHSLSQHSVNLMTSNYVFAETVTVISQRVNHQAALSFIRETSSPASPLAVHWIDPETEQQAIHIFTKQTSKNVSFVDCTNMAILQQKHITHIFSFDKVYQKNGYSLVQENVEG